MILIAIIQRPRLQAPQDGRKGVVIASSQLAIPPVAFLKARRFFNPAESPNPAPIGGAITSCLLLIRSMSARFGIRRNITRRAAREAGEPKSVNSNFLDVFTIWQSLTSRPRKL